MKDGETSNVVQLFPNPTDRQYENEIVPSLIDVLGVFEGEAKEGRYDLLVSVSESFMRYAIRSLITLDLLRRDGTFDDGKLPPITAYDIDHLAADCALAMGGERACEIADKLRNRSPVRGATDE